MTTTEIVLLVLFAPHIAIVGLLVLMFGGFLVAAPYLAAKEMWDNYQACKRLDALNPNRPDRGDWD